jgi:SOS response regulatory protein OraA/RecX
MTIRVRKVSENCFTVDARKTLAEGTVWLPPEPMDEKAVVEGLMKRGFHVQDIVDAMIEADPTWLDRQNAPGHGPHRD